MTHETASQQPDHAAPTALVVYASTHGHTAKIANRMADAMRVAGLDADVRDVDGASAVRVPAYDVVVVGASLHKEGHQRAMIDWVTTHRDGPQQRPSLFFSVSLSAAEDSDEARATTQACVDEFCERTGWTPGRTERVAGCLQYREYSACTRQLMRLLMRQAGHPTDASQDYDYTDWAGVDRIGREMAAAVGALQPEPVR